MDMRHKNNYKFTGPKSPALEWWKSEKHIIKILVCASVYGPRQTIEEVTPDQIETIYKKCKI